MQNQNDPEPLRYYDWIGWKLRQLSKEDKKSEKESGWNKNAMSYGQPLIKPWDEFHRSLNRIEEKLDLILIKLDGKLK